MKFIRPFLLLAILSIDCAQSEVIVSVNSSGSTYERTIKLVDIAKVEGGNERAQDLTAIRQLEVAESAPMGSSKFITLIEIQQRLVASFPSLAKRINYQGYGFVRVDSVGVLVDNKRITGTATECIDSWLNKNFVRFKRKMVTYFNDIARPRGSLSIKPMTCHFELSDRIVVMVDLYVDGILYQSYPIKFEVEVLDDVWVINRHMSAEAKLKFNDVTIKEVNIAQYRDRLIAVDENIERYRLKRNVQENEVLTRALVESIPEVEKNSLINVEANSGVVKVFLEVLALQDGRLMDEISVKNTNSDQIFSAQVVGKNRVVAK